jgi:hypothetical protein
VTRVSDLAIRWATTLSVVVLAGIAASGKAIAQEFGRRERWGRLVKQAGLADRPNPTAAM